MVPGRRNGWKRAVVGLLQAGTASSLSDEQLLDRFAARHDEGAEAAFATIVERHGPMVLAVCRRALKDPHDADDAFQATFLVLVRHATSVRRGKSLSSWLYGVAIRVSARANSASARRRAVESRAIDSRATEETQTDDCADVWDLVNRLPETLRVAVLLCYLEGLTHEQAASRLGWPVGTVRSRLARARDQLRRSLARRGFEPAHSLSTLLVGRVPLPANLVETSVRAAMLSTPRSALEVGVISASVVSLSEGVIRTMLFSKIRAAVLGTAATLCVTSAGVFAYQDEATPAKSALTTKDSLVSGKANLSPRARKLAWYGKVIPERARAAAVAQAKGDLRLAAEHTETVSRLSHEWNWMVRHSDPEAFPDSAYETPVDPPSTYEFVPPDGPSQPQVSTSPDTGLVDGSDVRIRIEGVERKLDKLFELLRDRRLDRETTGGSDHRPTAK
ncbi:RNA polymerase sigma factor [Singulisphaera rosea]